MTPQSQSRRGFLFRLGIALNVLGAALVGVPVVGYVFGAARRRTEGQSWITLGPVSGFPAGETRLATYENPVRVAWDGATAKIACWVRHIEGDRFQVFAVNCAHLGCPVRWFAQSRLFDTAPKPDFYFLALYALFALLPPWTETVVILVGPVLAIAALFLVPFLAGTGEKSWKRRPVAVLGVLVIVLTVATLAGLGVSVP